MKYIKKYNEVTYKSMISSFKNSIKKFSIEHGADTKLTIKILYKYFLINNYNVTIEGLFKGGIEIRISFNEFNTEWEKTGIIKTEFSYFLNELNKFKKILDDTNLDYYLDLETHPELDIIIEYDKDKFKTFNEENIHYIEGENLGLL